MNSMLTINNLIIEKRLEKPISFSLESGEIAYLLGPTGSGKTSILMSIAQLLPYKGDIKLGNLDLKTLNKKMIAKRIGFVLDEVEKQFVAHKVADEVAFTLENLSWDSDSIKNRVTETLKIFKIEHLMWRTLGTLSAGEKIRVALASAMVSDPDILLIDNILAHIDPPTRKEFMNYMEKLSVSGKIILMASYEEIRNGKNIQIGTAKNPLNFEIPLRSIGDEIIELNNISYGYRKDEPILNDITFSMNQSEIIALLGRNGSGKTTLSKIISGLIKPWDGSVKVRGKIAYVPEDPNLLFTRITPIDDISLSIKLSKSNIRAEDLLAQLGISQYAKNPIFSLSKGFKKIVAIAILLALKPDILIIDEPTAGLDSYYKSLMEFVFSKMASMGVTIMFVTHDIDFALRVADRFLVLKDGKIKYDGKPNEAIEL